MSYGTCDNCGAEDCEGYEACTIRSLRRALETQKTMTALAQEELARELARSAEVRRFVLAFAYNKMHKPWYEELRKALEL